MLRVVCLLTSDNHGYFMTLLNELVESPRFIQGKYGPMASLVPRIGAMAILKTYPLLLNQLVECLSVNHLAPIVSKFYKSLITNISSNEAMTDGFWTSNVCDSLVLAFCNSNKLITTNALRFWLPINLKAYPTSFGLIQNHLADISEKSLHLGNVKNSPERSLKAYAATVYLARKGHNIAANVIDWDICKKCLSSFEVGYNLSKLSFFLKNIFYFRMKQE